MAIIICPECGAKVSDRAPACPSCGVPLAGSVKMTPIGEYRRRPALGVLALIIGLVGIPLGIFTLSIIIGFFVLFGAVLSLGLSAYCFKPTASCRCPYCGGKGSTAWKDVTYKCLSCKNISAVDHRKRVLKTIEK